MQKFSEYEELVSDAVEDTYGERVRIEPRTNGEIIRGGADPDRDAAEITAIVDFQPKVMKSKYGGRYDADAPDMSGELLHVSIREGVLPYEVKQGDRIVCLDRGNVVFAVSVVEHDGIGRFLCRCKPART